MKINNKIIRLKRFSKPLCHCERRVAILFALALVLSLGIVAVPMAGTVEAGDGYKISLEAVTPDIGTYKNGTGISKTLGLRTNFWVGQIHEWVYDNTFQDPSMDNFYLDKPLASEYVEWSESTWHGLVSEDGSYAQAYGDPVYPARMTGDNEARFHVTSHFNDPAGDFSFDIVIVTSTGDIVGTVTNCAYNKAEDTWSITSRTYEGSGLEVQPLMETFVGPDEFYTSIQDGIDNVAEGGTVHVAAGTYNEGIIIINKDLTIIGASTPNKPIINPTADTGLDNVIGATGRGWFQVTEATVDFKSLVFDGTGKNIRTAIHYHENSTGGTVENCDFINIAHESLYHGRGINNYGQHVEVLSCTFGNIQRIGIFTYNTTATTLIDNCAYVGKGDGDWLDYGIEFSGGGSGTVDGCDISACTGVASVDDSISAGVLATDYYGTGTVATVKNSTFTGNTHGIYVGYNSTDATVLTAHFNNFSGNTYGIANGGAVEVDATNNWWGDASGPKQATTNPSATGDEVSDNVDYDPWYIDEGKATLSNAEVWVDDGWATLNLGDPADGHTFGHDAFATIQQGIDAVEPGGTVYVAAGEYDEQVVINKSLTLQGAGDTTIIKPSSFAKLANTYSITATHMPAGDWSPIIVAVTDGGSVTMENFMVDGSLLTGATSHWMGVYYRETGGVIDNITVQHIRADNVSKGAVGIVATALSSTVATEVKNCNVSDWDKLGIEAVGSMQTADIHHNTVIGRGTVENEVQNGIQITDSANATVHNNTISDLLYANYPTEKWSALGVVFGPSASGSANDNTITNCDAGIDLLGDGTSAQGNTITDVSVGLYAEIYVNATISFTGNTVTNCSQQGIGADLHEGTAIANVTISNNTLTNSVGTDTSGIAIQSESDVTGTMNAAVSGNEIDGWNDGIWLGSPVNTVTITNNTITNNIGTVSGIHIDEGVDVSNISAHNNSIVGNSGYGVYNGSTGIFDATNNWWGAASGPGEVGPGIGDKVSDNVDYDPWYIDVGMTTLSSVALSDLTVDGTTITGFDPSTLTYNKVLPYRTTEVPTVGATPTDSNASKVITQAINVTGTEAQRTATVVVTAEDGTTTKTYKVIFSVAANTDATLSDLTVDETTITGFDPSTLTYNKVLPYRTTEVPTVGATPTDSNASKVITQAINVTGTEVERTATVVVTAEDGTTQKTYKVIFSVAANTDATLSDLTVDGTTITGFDPSTLTYNKVLPYRTTEVPTVGATPTDSNASKVITQAINVTGTEVERTATVVVTAEDGTTQKTYKVIFGSIKVTITKTGTTTANQGNNITYTIHYKNEGTFDATNVVITETYPSEVEYVSATPAPDSGFNNKWTIGTLAPGAEGTITVTVHIK